MYPCLIFVLRLSAQTDSSCAFLDQLCRSEDLDTILPTYLSIIPPGIAKATALEATMDGGRLGIEAKQKCVDRVY